MSGTNEILPYAAGGGANVLSQALYAVLAERTNGAQTGTAVSANFNKAMRQATFVAAAITGWLAAQNVNVPDDGNLTTIVNNFLAQIPGKVVASVAALRALPKGGSGNALVLGYSNLNDGGGGEYYCDAADLTSVDNGGTIIVAADGGRWKLIWDGLLTPEAFGTKGDGTTDDTAAINACLAAAAAHVNQNISDQNQRRRYVPVWFVDAVYKITSQIVVPAGVQIVCDGGIILNALASTTTPALLFNAGSHCKLLVVNAAGGSGAQFGNVVAGAGQYCDMLIGKVRILGAGTTASILGVRIVGSRFDIEDLEVNGGNVGIDLGDGTTNGARLVNCGTLKVTQPATGIRFGSNCEHISINNFTIDTPSVVGISADGSRSLRARGIIFGDDGAAFAPCSSGYAVILGNTSAVSDISLDVTVNNTANVDNVVGTAIKISNCGQSNITVNASSATLSTGNAHRLKNGVEYGAGVGIGVSVQHTISQSIVPTVGSAAGNNSQTGSGIPAGTIIDFSGVSAPPGFLICPGAPANISRTTYSALFAAIGTAWGIGDGATTFGIPWFPADYAAVQANANVGTATIGQVIAHTHTMNSIISEIAGAALPNFLASGTVGAQPTTGSTGGTANLAAGVRVLKCVKI
jgi:hypothetical protein